MALIVIFALSHECQTLSATFWEAATKSTAARNFSGRCLKR